MIFLHGPTIQEALVLIIVAVLIMFRKVSRLIQALQLILAGVNQARIVVPLMMEEQALQAHTPEVETPIMLLLRVVLPQEEESFTRAKHLWE